MVGPRAETRCSKRMHVQHPLHAELVKWPATEVVPSRGHSEIFASLANFLPLLTVKNSSRLMLLGWPLSFSDSRMDSAAASGSGIPSSAHDAEPCQPSPGASNWRAAGHR